MFRPPADLPHRSPVMLRRGASALASPAGRASPRRKCACTACGGALATAKAPLHGLLGAFLHSAGAQAPEEFTEGQIGAFLILAVSDPCDRAGGGSRPGPRDRASAGTPPAEGAAPPRAELAPGDR